MTTLSTLLAASVLSVGSPMCAAAAWEPIIDTNGHLFPSALLSVTPRVGEPDQDPTVLGDGRMIVGAAVMPSVPNSRVTLLVECPDFIEPSVIEGTLPEAGEEYWLFPVLRLKVDALQGMKQQRPVNLQFTLSVNGERSTQTLPATLRSVNDCPWAFNVQGEFGEESMVAVPEMFAAYVNENHPYIDRLLREALDTEIVPSFDGMQSGDPQRVIDQVFAIWNVMQRKGIRYSNITTTASRTDGVLSQHVRLLDDSIDNAQANCVDGSVLLASILRKIDIEPMLVLVPGHCYLAFYADREETELIGLETTMMGQLDLREKRRAKVGTSAVSEDRDSDAVVNLLGGLVRGVSKSKGVDLSKQSATLDDIADVFGVIEEIVQDDDAAAEGDADGAADEAGELDEATIRSFETFIAAVEHGTDNLNEHADEFNDPNNDAYQIVSVAEARESGIMPIGYAAPARAAHPAPNGEPKLREPSEKNPAPGPKPKPKKSRLQR